MNTDENKYPLIQANYGVCQKYYATGLEDESELHYLLGEVYSGTSDITTEGLVYLKTKYGWKGLSELLANKGGLDAEVKTPNEISSWLVAYEKEGGLERE